MKSKLLRTPDSWTIAILRIVLGITVFPHGAQKLLGWFGGYGFEGTMNYFTESVGLPWIVGFAVIMLEFFGAIALIVGIGTRIVAAAFIVLAVGIVFSTHIQHGFFANWLGNQMGEGYEYFLFWIAMSIALLLNGAGKFSLDRVMLLRFYTKACKTNL